MLGLRGRAVYELMCAGVVTNVDVVVARDWAYRSCNRSETLNDSCWTPAVTGLKCGEDTDRPAVPGHIDEGRSTCADR